MKLIFQNMLIFHVPFYKVCADFSMRYIVTNVKFRSFAKPSGGWQFCNLGITGEFCTCKKGIHFPASIDVFYFSRWRHCCTFVSRIYLKILQPAHWPLQNKIYDVLIIRLWQNVIKQKRLLFLKISFRSKPILCRASILCVEIVSSNDQPWTLLDESSF